MGALSVPVHKLAPDGCHLFEFTSLPHPEEDGLKADVLWCEVIPFAKKWCQLTEEKETVDVVNVVETDVVMNPMSKGCMPSKRITEQLVDPSLVFKVSEESHNAMLDEMLSREALEYDPSRVVVGEMEEDELGEE